MTYPKFNTLKVDTLIEARVRFWLADQKAKVPDPKFAGEAAAIVEAGVVLLSAALQTYMERVFLECRDKVYANHSVPNDLKNEKNGCPKWGNPSEENLNRLFDLLGIKDPVDHFPEPHGLKERFSVTLKKINQVRNRISHGENPRIDGVEFNMNLSTLRTWTRASELCCLRFRFFVLHSSGLQPIQ
jgi:RiboL-PSP-HEPN